MNVTIEVYDTISQKIVEIEVDEEFAKEYKRMIWREENSDRAFRRHQTVTSELKGGEDDSFENFHEFIIGDEYDGSDKKAIIASYLKSLKKVMGELSEEDSQLIELLFFKSMSERQCAALYNCSQVNIHKKKERILCRLNKLLKS